MKNDFGGTSIFFILFLNAVWGEVLYGVVFVLAACGHIFYG